MHSITKHIPRDIKEKIMPAASVLYQYRPRFETRTFHAYCVGTPKSGTKSIANVLIDNFRSAHEPRSPQTIQQLGDWLEGQMSDKQFTRYLRARDKHLWFEMESAHILHHCLDLLVRTFPQAKFILTIRDCYSWLNSELNQHFKVQDSFPWGRMQKIRYQYGTWDFTQEDQVLSEYGLYPVASYLSYWTRHNCKVLNTVPPARLLVIRTHQIDDRLSEIAQFLGIPRNQMNDENSHSGQRKNKYLNVFDLVRTEYIEEQVEIYCRGLMNRFFPDAEPPSGEGA